MEFRKNISGKFKWQAIICLFAFHFTAYAQIDGDSTSYNSKGLSRAVIGTSLVYVGSLVALNQLWYADYEQSAFHTFNDNKQWQKMDKIGHVYSAYLGGMIGYEVLHSTGLDNQRASIYGGSLGFLFLSTVEVFDGYSKEWGFSWGDMLANGLGAGMFIGQQLAFENQIVQAKFSYSKTEFQKYRPDLLGESDLESIFKDYNGQKYWASINLNSLYQNIKPQWLNLALGYGAEGMVNARGCFLNGEMQTIHPYRQFLLSLDIDWTKIESNNEFTKLLLKALNTIKVPAPTMEFREGGFSKFHFLFF